MSEVALDATIQASDRVAARPIISTSLLVLLPSRYPRGFRVFSEMSIMAFLPPIKPRSLVKSDITVDLQFKVWLHREKDIGCYYLD